MADSSAPVPEALTVHAQSRVLEVVFAGGEVYRIPFELLRVYSPSAEVQGHGPGQEVLQTGKRDVTLLALERPAGMPLRLMLQRISTASRAVTSHLDLAAGEDRLALAAEHQARGASLVSTGDLWSTLTDTGGSPYCLTDRDPVTGFLTR